MINQIPLSKLTIGIPSFVVEDLTHIAVTGKSDSENNVAEWLLQIAQNTSDPCDSPTYEILNVVCHKLSVHQIVRTSYDKHWRFPIQRSPLDLKWWPLMLFLLLRKCKSEKPSNRDLGLQLKRINAAFSGIDIARYLGANEATLEQLNHLAEQRLGELTG